MFERPDLSWPLNAREAPAARGPASPALKAKCHSSPGFPCSQEYANPPIDTRSTVEGSQLWVLFNGLSSTGSDKLVTDAVSASCSATASAGLETMGSSRKSSTPSTRQCSALTAPGNLHGLVVAVGAGRPGLDRYGHAPLDAGGVSRNHAWVDENAGEVWITDLTRRMERASTAPGSMARPGWPMAIR